MKLGALLVLMAGPLTLPAAEDRREIGAIAGSGKVAAVRVGEVPLVHTATLLPFAGKEPKADPDLGRQVEQLLRNLDHALALGGSNLAHIAKLNLAVRDPELLARVESELARRFAGRPTPAVTLVVSTQSHPGVLVSGDAVGTAPATKSIRPAILRSGELYAQGRYSHAAVLPAGPRVYLSGKSAPGSAMVGGRASLEILKEVMAYAKVTPADVVQVKIMVTETAEADQLESVLAEFFQGRDLPPVTFVECKTPKPDVEIEMIAVGQPDDAGRPAQMDFLTPPRWKPGPQFSQIVRVNRGGLIYVSGFRGDAATDPERQAEAIFAAVKDAVTQAGGDMQHLAKAMYHITGKEGAAGMDKVRPKVFNPDGPPAASRNTVRHVGGAGGVMLVDMIGVVVEK